MNASDRAPEIDFAALSPLLALFGGAMIVLMLGLFRSRFLREAFVPFLAIVAFGAFMGLSIWQWGANTEIISAALRVDDFALYLNLLFAVAGIVTVLLSWRAAAPREAAHGEYYAMLLCSVGGMAVLVGAQNTVTLFIGFELLSIPLYVLCATEMRRSTSLESGLKYLIIGSVGSATLVYGLALLYGATGSTDFSGMRTAIAEGDLVSDTLLLGGIALVLVGLAFKASVAPFHQWTPDVYEGAPTPITAFMAVATKAAAFGILLRLFDYALIDAAPTWGAALATLATVTIIVGNVGALTQTSLKRLLAWSSVAQAGYLLAGVVVASETGLEATLFYLAVYMIMNLAAFAVIVARQRAIPGDSDHIDSVSGIGFTHPWLAWPLTIAMLALAGIPATGGFIGKFAIISALVEGGYTWLGIVIVLGSAVSLAYYLRVVAAMWMPEAGLGFASKAVPVESRPALAGGSSELDPPEGPTTTGSGAGAVSAFAERHGDTAEGGRSQPEVVFVAVLFGVATVATGIIPGPLFELVRDAGASFPGLI